MRIVISDSNTQNKRYQATFYDDDKKIKTVSFGLKGGSTYIDHRDDKKKSAYLARHSKNNEDWNDFMSAGSLSRWLLWSKPTITDSLKDYKKRFKLT